MSYKLYLLGFASLLIAPSAVNAQSFTFFSSGDCSGNNFGYCDGSRINYDGASEDYCYWNSWVGSIGYNTDDPDISAVFYGCNSGDTANWECNGPWTIAVPGGDTGCQYIGTSLGLVDIYNNNDPTCNDCIGG